MARLDEKPTLPDDTQVSSPSVVENNTVNVKDNKKDNNVETPKEKANVETPKEKANTAMLNAAAASAVMAASEAQSELTIRQAEKMYVIEKKKDMLNRCKNDDQVAFVGQKIFANYFGSVYTFTYNCVPVTVKFDGSTQYFPKFIYDRLMEKISEVSDSNTNKEEIEYM